MTRRDALVALVQLAALIETRELGKHAQAIAARDGIRARIDTLDAGLAPAKLDDTAASLRAASAAVLHQTWAASRRSALNVQLAAASASALNTRDAAQQAHGRAEVLRVLAARHARSGPGGRAR